MFRRRKGQAEGDAAHAAGEAGEAGEAEELDPGDDLDEIDDEQDDAAPDEARPTPPSRPRGPWDVEDVPEDGLVRLDLGAVRVPGVEGADIQVNLEESTGQVMAVTLVVGESALQLQAFAAPRSEATWTRVRSEIAAQITADGGLADVDQESGDLRAQLPFPQPDGSVALGAVRFVGVDGPRWLLRGVLSGVAAGDAAAAEPLLAAFRGVVVVRGSDPFAPGDPLPLRLPDEVPSEHEDAADQPGPLDLDGTGQRTTEIR